MEILRLFFSKSDTFSEILNWTNKTWFRKWFFRPIVSSGNGFQVLIFVRTVWVIPQKNSTVITNLRKIYKILKLNWIEILVELLAINIKLILKELYLFSLKKLYFLLIIQNVVQILLKKNKANQLTRNLEVLYPNYPLQTLFNCTFSSWLQIIHELSVLILLLLYISQIREAANKKFFF